MQERSVELHGARVAYRTAGDGPAIVLIHGMAGSSETWMPAGRGLAAFGTVVAVDLPGHGASVPPPGGDYSLGAMAAVVRDLLAALGQDRATVVGHSLGGGIALQFAYQFPERCERLVLVSSGGLGREVAGLLRALSIPGAEYVLAAVCTPRLQAAARAVSGLIARAGLRPAPAASDVWRSYELLGDSRTRAAFVNTLRAVVDVGGQRVSATDRLYLADEMPTLIVWGERDPFIPVAHGRAAHEAMPGSRLHVFPGAGHYPHRDEPDAFAALVGDFLKSAAPADAVWHARLR